MTNTATLKTAILASLDVLPAGSLKTLADFTSFLRAKSREQSKPPFVKLRGLWSGTPAITEDDLTEIRREMWGHLGNRAA